MSDTGVQKYLSDELFRVFLGFLKRDIYIWVEAKHVLIKSISRYFSNASVSPESTWECGLQQYKPDVTTILLFEVRCHLLHGLFMGERLCTGDVKMELFFFLFRDLSCDAETS